MIISPRRRLCCGTSEHYEVGADERMSVPVVDDEMAIGGEALRIPAISATV